MTAAQQPAAGAKRAGARKAGDPAAEKTAELATRFKSRAARRASRSVSNDLVVPADLASVVRLAPDPVPVPGPQVTVADPDPTTTPGPRGAEGPPRAGEAAPEDPVTETTPGGGTTAAETTPDDPGPDAAEGLEQQAGPNPIPVEETAETDTPDAPVVEEGPGARPTARPTGRRRPSGQAPELVRPVAGPDGRLELSGERVDKMTLELPLPLVDALAVWERDETKATGQRVYRERLIDCALSQLPSDVDAVVDLARGLPPGLRHADTEQVGTRVRESIKTRLKDLRPELRVRRVKDVYLRHVYAAAIARYLTEMGVPIPDGD